MLTAGWVWFVGVAGRILPRPVARMCAAAIGVLAAAGSALAQEAGGEANLQLPDVSQVNFLGLDGHTLLLFGIGFCVLGLIFGLTIYSRLKNLPVHRSCGDRRADLRTCKLPITQGKFCCC
jgi:K(+)-stimulated pyrophosphate-energized sodium pump